MEVKLFKDFLDEALVSLEPPSPEIEVALSGDPIPLVLVDGDWEIKRLIGVSTEPPVDESIIINPGLSGEPVKRGDDIYITAVLNRTGGRISRDSIGVIRARVIDIYNSLEPLNRIMRR